MSWKRTLTAALSAAHDRSIARQEADEGEAPPGTPHKSPIFMVRAGFPGQPGVVLFPLRRAIRPHITANHG